MTKGAPPELAWDPEMKAALAALRRATGGFPDKSDPSVAEMRENYIAQRLFLNGEARRAASAWRKPG